MIKVLLALIFLCIPALAHDGMEQHEQFYARWNRPDMRNGFGARFQSCCNKLDCAPAATRFYLGSYWWRDAQGTWKIIRPEALEMNYSDELDTPDGRSHICARGDYVICAVIGTGH